MKKVLKAGKKPLSLLLAVVMLITTWVFVAPTTAGAVNSSDNYYVRISWKCTSSGSFDGDYEGTEGGDHEDTAGFKITYKDDNGTGAEKTVYWNIGDNSPVGGGQYLSISNNGSCESTGSFTATAKISGFPTKFYGYINDNRNIGGGETIYEVTKIEVGSIDSKNVVSNMTTIWQGNIHLEDTNIAYAAWVTPTGQGNWKSSFVGNTDKYAKITTDSKNWVSPTPTSVKDWNNFTDVTLKKESNGVVDKEIGFAIYDQYGVRMNSTVVAKSGTVATEIKTNASDPKITAECGTSSTNTYWYKENIASGDSDLYKQKLHLKNAMKQEGENNEQTVTVNVKVGTKTLAVEPKVAAGATAPNTFKINDPKYTFTFKGNGGTVTPSSVEVPYGSACNTTVGGSREGFDLKGMYEETIPDSYEKDNTSGKTVLSTTTEVKEDKTWNAAWQANQYTISYRYTDTDGSEKTIDKKLYYGRNIADYAPVQGKDFPDNFRVDDTIYSFKSWNHNGNDTVPASKATWDAEYNEEFKPADYTKLVEQINRANDKKTEEFFDEKYTEESYNAFIDRLKEANDFNNAQHVGESQQDLVNGYTKRLSDAIDGLRAKKFTVIFADEDNKIIKYDFVDYGAKVTRPDTIEKAPDADYHYEFAGWDSSENSDDISACEKVTDDLMFIAKFNAIPHNWEHETVPSECTTDGIIKHSCPDCGYEYTEANEADKAHHRFEEKVIVAATCSAVGYKANVCSKCGAIEKDSKVELKKLDHTWNHTTEDETWDELAPATCYNHGAEKRTCSVCGAIEVREIRQLSHNYGDATIVEPTCTVGGHTERTCARCGYVEITNPTPAKGHNEESPWTTRSSATCTSDGYEVQICSDCGVIINTRKIDASGHKWSEDGSDGWTVRYASTCVGYGIEERTCLTCNKTEYREIAMKDHTEVIDEAVPATCTSGGLTAGTHCSFCGRVLTPQEPIGALGHNYDSAWTTKSEATCQSNGYEVQICDRDGCGEILDTRVIDAIPHVWDYADDAERWEEVKAATCTEDGLEKRTCTATTGHPHEETRVIPKTGHNMGTTVHAPTCTAYGYTEYGCLNGCDLESYQSDFVAPLGHDWNDGVITKEATCTENGVKTYKCKRDDCGVTKTEVIPNNGGHNYVEDSAQYVEPTNSANGKKVLKCSKCGDEITVIISAQGHEFEIVNTDPATCTKDGKEYYDCKTHTGDKDCGLEYTNTIPALGHDMVLDLSDARTKEATCTEDGLQVFKCNRTGCTHEELVTVPKLGHDLKFVKEVLVSCQEYGYDLYECDRCGVQVKIFDMSVEPGNDHHWTEIQYHVDPTCVERGFDVITCRVCGASYRDNFVAPLGHAWDEGHHIDPTCTEPGGTLYTCTRTVTDVDKNGNPITTKCGATKLEDEEPALGHDMGQWYFAPDGDHYVNKRDCNREGCPYSEYEEINGEKVVYYKVDFVSYKYVGEYYTAGDGTKLAYSMDEQPDAYKEVVVDTQYIKSGEPCEYAGEKLELPKTKAFGVYNLTGWKLDKGDLSNVTTNITAKAQFQGEGIYYEVNFYSYDGHLVKGPVYVLHGHPVAKDDRPFDEYVTRPNNNQYKYEFTGKWDKDIEAIYSTGPIHAVFKQIPLTYKVVFHDWDGKVITSQILGYGEGVNESNKIIFDNMKPRKEDDAYIYEWTPASRRWVDAKGNIIDENHVKVPDNQGYQEYTPEKEKDEFLSDREKGIFHVYASYPQKVKYYRFNVSAKYADGSIAEGATVTVQSPDGQLVYTTKLNEKGTATVTVEHYEYVTVNITGGGETNSLKIGLGKDNIVDGYFGNEGDEIPSFAFELSNYVDPDPDHGGSTKCRCICHTFLGGLWINFLNILYRLFGKKTVCCHDMYEKHGDRLAYGK